MNEYLFAPTPKPKQSRYFLPNMSSLFRNTLLGQIIISSCLFFQNMPEQQIVKKGRNQRGRDRTRRKEEKHLNTLKCASAPFTKM